MSGYRCVSDCRSRGREFDPGPVPYFRGDWSWNDFYGHSPPLRWFIQEGLLSVTSESMCTNYWLTACSSLPRKSVVRWTDRPAMTIAVDLGRKATNKQKTNKVSKLIFATWHVCLNFVMYRVYINTTSERLKETFFICLYFSIYEQLNFILSWAEHEKSVITSGPGLQIAVHYWSCEESFLLDTAD